MRQSQSTWSLGTCIAPGSVEALTTERAVTHGSTEEAQRGASASGDADSDGGPTRPESGSTLRVSPWLLGPDSGAVPRERASAHCSRDVAGAGARRGDRDGDQTQ